MFFKPENVEYFLVKDISLFYVFFGNFEETSKFLTDYGIQLRDVYPKYSSTQKLAYFETTKKLAYFEITKSITNKNYNKNVFFRILIIQKTLKNIFLDPEVSLLVKKYFNVPKISDEQLKSILKDDFKRAILINNRLLKSKI